jgi:hypothetical protein
MNKKRTCIYNDETKYNKNYPLIERRKSGTKPKQQNNPKTF